MEVVAHVANTIGQIIFIAAFSYGMTAWIVLCGQAFVAPIE